MKKRLSPKEMKGLSVSEICSQVFGNCPAAAALLSMPIANFNPATGTSNFIPYVFRNGGDFIPKGSKLETTFYLDVRKNKGKIVGLQITGYKPFSRQLYSRAISAAVRRYFKGKQTCVNCTLSILDGGKKTCDHKCGSYDQPNFNIDDPKNFQMLCQHCNLVKRSCCKKCNDTGFRFDARKIPGEKLGWQVGGKKKEGTCEGCYWNDIVAWRLRNNDPSFVTRKRILMANQDNDEEVSCVMRDDDSILD